MERMWLAVFFLSESLVLSSCLLRHYHFVDQSLTWTEAQTYCRQTYTDLATVENSEEVEQLINTLSSAAHNSEVWIGLYHEINWRWSDGFTGSGADFRKWAKGGGYNRPQFSNGFCVSNGYLSSWWDINCELMRKVVCYRGSQQNPEFVLVDQTMNWSRAQSYCRENFIDLVTVRNDEDHQRIVNIKPSDSDIWIGLFRDPDYFWSDGCSFLFNNWDGVKTPLNSSRVVCGVTSDQSSGKWKFLSCDTKLPFVCYSYPIKKQLLKMRMKVGGSVDLKDPDVKAEILKQLQDRLKEDGVSGVTLKWREQPDGEVFHKETEDTEKTDL